MQLFEIENANEFMGSLFVKDWLDAMEVVEAEITTFFHIKMDGRRRFEWYDSAEQEQNSGQFGEFITWKEYKQQAYQIIKGKKVPSLFRLVLRMPKKGMERLASVSMDLLPSDIQGAYLNIKYEKKQLSIVTGVSITKFSMDKSIEREWDMQVEAQLKKRGLF